MLCAGDVTEAGGVPGAGVPKRDLAVHVLATLLDVEVGEAVLHRALGADLDAVHRVDDPDEAREADLDVVVDADASRLLDGPHQKRGPAERERRIDLCGAVTGYVDQRVTRDRHQQVRTRAGVQQHDRVGASTGALAGAELQLLLAGETFTTVTADQQVVGSGLRCRPGAGRGLATGGEVGPGCGGGRGPGGCGLDFPILDQAIRGTATRNTTQSSSTS